jgi:hypothetical protein
MTTAKRSRCPGLLLDAKKKKLRQYCKGRSNEIFLSHSMGRKREWKMEGRPCKSVPLLLSKLRKEEMKGREEER